MKKKPEVQKIFDNLDNYTDIEIDKLSQPFWIRKELKKHKALKSISGFDITSTNSTAEMFADIMQQKSIESNHDSNANQLKLIENFIFSDKYPVVEWMSDTWHMPYSFLKNSNSTIDIEPNDIFLLLDFSNQLIVYEHRFVKLSEKDFQYFLSHSRKLNLNQTIEEYKKFNMERLEKKHGLYSENDYIDPPKHPMEHLIDKNQRKFTSRDFR